MDELRLQTVVDQRMSMRATPMLIHAMSLLPVGVQDLSVRIDRALQDNPLLERAPGMACPSCGRHFHGRHCIICASVAPPREQAVQADWRNDLKLLVRAELPSTERAVVGYVIDCLDERGFLPAGVVPADGIADIDSRRVDRILATIRRIGPSGIAAASPLDCVRRQVRQLIDEGEAPELLSTIVDDHTEDAAAGDFASIATDLAVSTESVEAAVSLLRRRVRPFVALSGEIVRPPVPDLVIHVDDADRQRLTVVTTNARWFGVRLDPTLLAYSTESEWLEPLRLQALDLLRQIEMRASMLHRIGAALIDHQREFLLGDAAGHRRLRRADLAAVLGVHPSTVGRSVDAKVLRCPDGRTIALAECFGGQTGPKERLRALLDCHPAANDTELQLLLGQVGIVISRRTVAKYRSALSVPARLGRRS